MVFGEEVEDVGVDDCVVVVADVPKEMACFFVAEAWDGVDEPAAAVFSVEALEGGEETVCVLACRDDVGCSGREAVVVGAQCVGDVLLRAGREERAEGVLEGEAVVCLAVGGKQAVAEFVEDGVRGFMLVGVEACDAVVDNGADVGVRQLGELCEEICCCHGCA